MRRPIYVRQNENHAAWPVTYWYTVSRGNGQPTMVSETFASRSGAIRGARSTIDLFDRSVPVVFTYWRGRIGAMEARTEHIHGDVS